MKILKRIVFFLVALLALLFIGGFFLPSSSHVERNIVISVSRVAIFPWINEMDRFNEWSPWVEIDPDAQYELTGPTVGVGAKMSWQGEKSGTGSQEIIESVENEYVRVKLDFGSQGQAISYYRLNDEENSTRLTWGFDSDHGYNILHRYFGLLLDKWVGKDYETGLVNLKVLVESIAAQEKSIFDIADENMKTAPNEIEEPKEAELPR